LRIIGKRWGVVEKHFHAMTCQLVEHDDLIGIHPSQSIGRQTPDGIKLPSFGGIAQRVEARAVQPRT